VCPVKQDEKKARRMKDQILKIRAINSEGGGEYRQREGPNTKAWKRGPNKRERGGPSLGGITSGKVRKSGEVKVMQEKTMRPRETPSNRKGKGPQESPIRGDEYIKKRIKKKRRR